MSYPRTHLPVFDIALTLMAIIALTTFANLPVRADPPVGNPLAALPTEPNSATAPRGETGAVTIMIPMPPIVMPAAFAPFAEEFANTKDAEKLYNIGVTAYIAKQFARGGAAFTEAIAIRRSFTDAYFNRALCFEGLNDWKSAIADFTLILKKRPQIYDAYVERGRCYKMSGDIDKAKNDVAFAKTLKPNRSDAYTIFGDPMPAKK